MDIFPLNGKPNVKSKLALQSIAAVLLGGYFMVSAIGKLLNVQLLIATIKAYGVPSSLAPASILLPPLEMILGVLVMLPATRKISSRVLIILLGIFTGAFLYAHFFRGVQQCGCSGRFAFLDKNLTQLLVVNSILLVLSIYILGASRKYTGLHSRSQKSLIIIVVVLSLAATGLFSIDLFKGAKWKAIEGRGQPTPFSGIVAINQDSTYAIFFYETDCPHCWDAVGNVMALKSEKVVDEVIGCTFGDDGSLAKFENDFHPNFPTQIVSVEKFFATVNSVPTIFFVQDDTVAYSDEGIVRSPQWYREHVFK